MLFNMWASRFQHYHHLETVIQVNPQDKTQTLIFQSVEGNINIQNKCTGRCMCTQRYTHTGTHIEEGEKETVSHNEKEK